MDLQGQYRIAKERAGRFVRANGLKPLWPTQAPLDIVAMHTDIYENGLTPEERVRRVALRIEWLARVHTYPLNSIPYGYRKE